MPLTCYQKGLLLIMLVFTLIAGSLYVFLIMLPIPLIGKVIISVFTLGAVPLILMWTPLESHVKEGGVLLIGLVRKKFVPGEVVEEYTGDEVKKRLGFVPAGNRVILDCFFWGFYGSFQRRNGEWVSVDVYAGRDCRGRWLLLRLRRDKYLLICPGNA